MNGKNSLLTKFAYNILKKNLLSVHRHKELLNFKTARNAGVLFYAVDQSTLKLVNEFVNYLNNNNIEVFPLIIVENKKLIDHYLYRKGYNFVTKDDINWLNIPKGTDVEKFIETPFDILFNLSIDNFFSTTYIQALSKSKMKVGKLLDKSQTPDISFDLRKANEEQLELKHEIEKERQRKPKKNDIEIENEIEIRVGREIEISFLIEEIKRYIGMFDKYITFHPSV